jgi:hypothetical protein
MKVEQVRNFKEDIDYLVNLLENPNLTQDVKDEINKAIKIAIRYYSTPVLIYKGEDEQL